MAIDLAAEAFTFGQELQAVLDGVLPCEQGTDPELRRVAVTAGRLVFVIEVGAIGERKAQTVPLLGGGAKVAELFVQIRLVADSANRFPAVAKSMFELRINRHPLLRLDYGRDFHTVPACHWNVHAERGALTHVLAQTKPDYGGELSKVHLPVGGFRMRPCIEDFLQLLVDEFGFDHEPGYRQVIEEGRIRWRDRQLAAMVRDNPEVAARALRAELGYQVTPPPGGNPPARRDRLIAW